MKLKFKTQAHQTAAVQAVVDCFRGQPPAAPASMSLRIGLGKDGLDMGDLFTEGGFRNVELQLTDAVLLENIRAVQQSQSLPLSNALVETEVAKVNLDVEMETGTGKTYCYIKTIFELNNHYGWSKFIIVVPSIAIREGVAKSLQITAEHFLETYHRKVRFFIYDSKQLHRLESFSSDAGIHVMVINVQAFSARGADNRRIYDELDDFQSRRPIDVISASRPILILDEPQKMEGAATLKSLEEFKAPIVLRYSATHRTAHHKVHRLDALDAYNQKLVKKIAVRGIAVKGLTGSTGYLYLQSIEISLGKSPEARVEFEQKLASGEIRRALRRLGRGDDLFELSNGLEQYRQGFVVAEIDANSGTLSFGNGVELIVGDAIGDVSESVLRRLQIREAIRAHFGKEQALFLHGVKALTLFFIDEVRRYRDYAAADEKGEYARIFEEEYRICLDQMLGPDETPYVKYLKGIPAEKTHRGYFSIDKKSKRLTDPSVAARGENAGLSDDADAYELILRDKERLLSLSEPVRFIFSHSALREGWDNPNVFTICTLKHSDNTLSRRQEVGRGLRLAVNQNGERMDHPDTVHEINVLTVVASESYKDFVAGLQKDIGDALIDRVFSISQLPEIGNDRYARKNPLDANFEQQASKELWNRINHQAACSVEFDSGELVRKAVRRLNDKDAGLRLTPLHYAVQHGEQAAALTCDGIKVGDAFESKTMETQFTRASIRSAVKYDLIGKLAEGTRLTRRTIAQILTGLDTAVFAQFKSNPEGFIVGAVRMINEQKARVIVEHLAYDPGEDAFGMDIFAVGQTRKDFGKAVRTPIR